MQINFVAVLVATIINFAIGFLMYSVLFSKQWSEWSGMKHDPNNPVNPAPLYLQAIVATFVTYFVLAHIVDIFHANTFYNGAHIGLLCWFGFIMPVQFTANLFSGKTRKLFFFDTSYQLISILVGGGILAVWK